MPSYSKKTNVALWTVQGLLAALFLFAGAMKLVMPIEAIAAQSNLPGVFLRFIGVCETLGAIGLILPLLLRNRPWLTPIAAVGLVIIMAGATTLTIETGPVPGAIVPAIVGILATVVAFGRWRFVEYRTQLAA